jgi:Tol biopolymer transport system component
MLAMLAVLAVLAAAPASAAAQPARLAFDGDGAIYTMEADGSGRVRLTEGDAERGTVSDDDPHWSPNGQMIVFTRDLVKHPASERRRTVRSRIWAMRADGTGERRVVSEPEKGFADYLVGVTPGGRVIYARAGFRRGRFRLILTAVDLDGSHRKLLLRSNRLLWNELSFSPDGEHILFTRHDYDRNYFDHPSLFVMRSDGTHRRRLLKDAGPGVFSPDGRRIAFVSVRDRNGITCSSDTCDWNGEIYAMRRDGSDRVRLTHSAGDDRNPSWSPDAKRIAFDSDRNYQGYGDNSEIYSVGADGSCLTWLTNGTVFSERPQWRPRPAGPTAPAACGDAGREPLVEVDRSRLPSFDEFPSYWLGERGPRGTILDDVGSASRRAAPVDRYVSYWYYDCGEYRPAACGEPVSVVSDTTCLQFAMVNDLPADIGTSTLRLRRGALVSQRDDDSPVHVFTGRVTVTISGQTTDPGGLVDALRRSGDDAPAARFRAPLFPAEMWKRLREAEESFARTHDEEATAEELGIRPSQVRHRLRLARRLRELGVDGRMRCPQ